jgi:hypothetical protein
LYNEQIGSKESRYLINQIVNSIRALEDVVVVVSLPFPSNHNNIKPCISYDKMVLTRFNKCIEITDKENKIIDVKIMNNNEKIFQKWVKYRKTGNEYN